MDSELEMVVVDVQRQIAGIPIGKTNIGRGVVPSDSLLHETLSL